MLVALRGVMVVVCLGESRQGAVRGQRLRGRVPRVWIGTIWRSACTASPTPPTPGATCCRAWPTPATAPSPLSAGLRADRGTRGRPLPDGGAGARRDRAARGARRRRRRRPHRPRLGRVRPPTARRATSPSDGEGRRAGGAARRQRSAQAFLTNLDQLQALLVHVLLPAPAGRSRGAGQRPRVHRQLWRDWSPGFDAAEELALVKPSLRDPANLAAALGYYRATLGDRLRRPGARRRPGRDAGRARRSRCSTCTAPTTAASAWRSPRRRGRWSRENVNGRDRRRRRPLPPPRTAGDGQPADRGVPDRMTLIA